MRNIDINKKIKLGIITIICLILSLLYINIKIENKNQIKDLNNQIETLKLELKLEQESNERFKEALKSQVQLTKKYKSSNPYYKSIRKDLDNRIYNKLINKETSDKILESVLKYSSKYNINPLIVYAIICQESSLIPTLLHNPVVVDVYGKKVKTQAIGLGGVIYEIWADKLHKHNIVKTKNDLFKIDRNIEATAFILSEFKKLKAFKNRTKNETMILRYFGGNNAWYLERINKKITSLL